MNQTVLLTNSEEQQLQEAIFHTNPYIYYPMNERNGLFTLNKSPLNRHLLNGDISGVTIGQPSKRGVGYVFDGVNDAITSTTGNPSSTDLTITGIINWGGVNTAVTTQSIITKRDSFGGTTMMWGLALDKNNSYKFLVYGNGGSFPFWNYTPPIGTSIHFAWVHDTAASVDRLYINGSQHSTLAIVTFGTGTATSIRIGTVNTTNSEFLKVNTLRHLTIHGSVLTPGTIKRLARLAGFN